MKHHFEKLAALLLVLVMVLGMTACVNQGSADGSDSTAITFEGEDISLDEAKLYAYVTQFDTERFNDMMIAMYYGSFENFWAYESGTSTYAVQAVETAVRRLIQTKTLVKKAKADGITLDAEEQGKVKDAVASFKETYAKVIEKAGSSDELIERFVNENALANKVYLKMVDGIDTTFDAAAMRGAVGEGLSIIAKTSYTVKTEEDDKDAEAADGEDDKDAEAADDEEDKDAEGESESEEAKEETIEIPEDEQVANREAAVMYFMDGMRDGIDVQDLIDDYEDADLVTMVNVSPIEVNSTYALEDGKEPENYLQKMWTMHTGDLEKFEITNTSGTIVDYVLHCSNDDDPDVRAKSEADELEKRKAAKFEEAYAKVTRKYRHYHVYDKVMQNVKITEPLYESEYMNAAGATE